jgi:hypothetical protein
MSALILRPAANDDATTRTRHWPVRTRRPRRSFLFAARAGNRSDRDVGAGIRRGQDGGMASLCGGRVRCVMPSRAVSSVLGAAESRTSGGGSAHTILDLEGPWQR